MSLMNRRQILQAASAGVATLSLAPLTALADDKKEKVGYTLPRLPYKTDALEPHIDAKTMEIHHNRHHLAYVTGANNVFKANPDLFKPVDQLLAEIKTMKVPSETVRRTLINMVGGHSNHTIFWEIMGPKGGGEPTGALAKAITRAFGSFDKFQKGFSTAASTQFGSGWAWLVVNKKGELEIVQRPNQDSPIMDGLKPVLGLDVWEHAYYLKYQNRRPDYITAWWNTVNWAEVARKVAAAKKS